MYLSLQKRRRDQKLRMEERDRVRLKGREEWRERCSRERKDDGKRRRTQR